MALAVTTCTAGMSLAACSAGITTARPGPSASASPAAASHSASPSPSASPSASASAGAASTVRVNAPIRSFPVPKGASVEYNGSCPKQIALLLGPVAPSASMSFYTAALPRAGYKVTGNVSSGSGDTEMMELEFTGHGYTGQIGAFADMEKAIGSAAGSPVPSAPPGMFAGMTKNVTEVQMSPPGVPDTYNYPGTPGS